MDPQISFTITFVSLLVSSLLNIVESLRTSLPHVRHILSVEATITLIAAYFYTIFISKHITGNWSQITQLRYLDWAFTTPLMLLALCLILSHNSKTKVTAMAYVGIVVLDLFMLYMGYLGETKQLNRTTADVTGYVGYIGIFAIIFQYVKKISINYVIFGIYAVIWGMYGVVYYMDEYNKNMITNTLDMIAKAGVGIGLWLYYTGVIH
jgi:bacteriorhodopsin